jgi:hypothetical protein
LFCRRWLVAAVALAAFPLVPGELLAQQSPAPAGNSQAPPPQPKPEWIDIPLQPPGETPAAAVSSLPEIKFPNFASCPIAEIQLAVPELAHLKAAQDQSQLTAFLDKIGAKTVEIARKTPNLVSHEAVVSEQNGFTTRADYSFLILQHVMVTGSRVFDEYRVDVATGDKLQTDFIEKAAESAAPHAPPSLADVPPAGPILPQPQPQSPGPVSQGSASAWLYFYPTNRSQLEFRYLGQQKMNGRQTQVVAFAQKPGSVLLPAVIGYNGQIYKIFMQGVAWIDPAEFRIERLRSDLLSVPAGVPLRQLSVDIEFAQMSIVDVPSPLWLPTQVVITENLAGSTARESHTYSNYRLFRTRSKIVLK